MIIVPIWNNAENIITLSATNVASTDDLELQITHMNSCSCYVFQITEIEICNKKAKLKVVLECEELGRYKGLVFNKETSEELCFIPIEIHSNPNVKETCKRY